MGKIISMDETRTMIAAVPLKTSGGLLNASSSVMPSTDPGMM